MKPTITITRTDSDGAAVTEPLSQDGFQAVRFHFGRQTVEVGVHGDSIVVRTPRRLTIRPRHANVVEIVDSSDEA